MIDATTRIGAPEEPRRGRADERPLSAVLIASDPFFAQALPWLLQMVEVRVLARGFALEETRDLVSGTDPDLLVIEASNGIDPAQLYNQLRHLHRSIASPLPTVVVCSADDCRMREAALAGGATGAVRGESAAEILGAIDLVRGLPAEEAIDRAPRLTRRELEILRLVSEGRTNREVAEVLWVTTQTVKFHLANVYRKLGLGSRAEAVEWARRHGLASPRRSALAVRGPARLLQSRSQR